MSKLRRGRVTGPLARYEAGFANALAVEGYAPGSIGNQQLRMAQLSRWLEAEGLDTGALSAEVVERFLASRRAAGCSYYVTLRGFSPAVG